jgi:hypothetical protein
MLTGGNATDKSIKPGPIRVLPPPGPAACVNRKTAGGQYNCKWENNKCKPINTSDKSAKCGG